MPSLFTVCGYKIYFWSNEANEPLHVHISKGKPSPNATKVWLTNAAVAVSLRTTAAGFLRGSCRP